MSATNRGSKREPNDLYQTPSYTVNRLLDEIVLPTYNTTYLEPGAGTGNIIKAVNNHYTFLHNPVSWDASELNFWAYPILKPLVQNLYLGKYQDQNIPVGKHSVHIGNPPYLQAMEFINKSLSLQPEYVIYLLRTNFLESEERVEFFRGNMPDVYTLPNRPSFVKGGTDACSYSWMVWPRRSRTRGFCQVLANTPLKERRGK
jgi:hypothetical protein